MANQSVEALVEGGKATAAPPLGPALGPLGVNIGKVIADINAKTASFRGMQVPVKVIVDMDSKDFKITIGTPPTSALIKKEAKLEKGSGKPNTDYVAELKIEQIIKISMMKKDSMLGKTTKARVKEVIGTCRAMGVLVEGVKPQEALALVDQGKFDAEIKAEKTEISAEEMKELEEERKRLQQELETRRAEFEAKAKDIMASMEGKEKSAIKAKMKEAGLPEEIIHRYVPAEAKAEAGKPAEKKPEPAKK